MPDDSSKEKVPYGSWRSPITSDLVVQDSVGLSQPLLDSGSVYWIESRAQEKGRAVIVRLAPDGSARDVTPQRFNVRTKVHEYGGGAYTVRDGVTYFSHSGDQRLYIVGAESRRTLSRAPIGNTENRNEGPESLPALTPEGPWRYADMEVDVKRDRVICVREDHSDPRSVVNELVAICGSAKEVTVLVSGADFYSNPRVSQDGNRLCWLAWNLPNMPWDGCGLWSANIRGDGSLGQQMLIAGGQDEWVFQPEWSPGGELYFVAETTGWMNLYRSVDKKVEPVVLKDSEFATPQWVFGMRTYGFASENLVVCAYNERGRWRLGSVDTESKSLTPYDLPFTEFSGVRAEDGIALFVASSPKHPPSVVQLDAESGQYMILKQATDHLPDPMYLSDPELVEYSTKGNQKAFGLYYSPKNRDFTGPEGEKPPLLVKVHGGPTGSVSTSLDLRFQFWTSRGFAVLDVNYGGSTGYGREYRRRLDGLWGVLDVDDCIQGALYLVGQGKVDREKLAIEGASSGGYLVLCALTFRDVFKAGVSYYGFGNIEVLAEAFHKFESRYVDRLVGPYPRAKATYAERSPIHFAKNLSSPVLMFQGTDDTVVLSDQAETMASTLREQGVSVALVTFEGEGHGFRRAETIKRCLDAELYFFSKIFGFKAAGELKGIEIENL